MSHPPTHRQEITIDSIVYEINPQDRVVVTQFETKGGFGRSDHKSNDRARL
jgi:hypothetical protein